MGINVAQTLITGILEGGFYALAAVGLSLIFGVQRILNVAQGAFIVLAAFVTIQFSLILTPKLNLDPLYSLVVDFVLLGVLGGFVYFLLIYKIENSGFEAPLLATFGLSIFLEYIITNGLEFSFTIFSYPVNLKLLAPLDPSGGFGALAQHQNYSFSSVQFMNLILPEPQLIALILAITCIPLLQLFLSKTYAGKAIRATGQDWQAAEFSGIDIRKTRLLCFSLGSAFAGLAGGIYAFSNSVTASSADISLLPLILVVIILGGVGSIIGTLVGGLIVGLIMNLSDLFEQTILTGFSLPAGFGMLVTFMIFLIVLMVKPTGIFGRSN